MYEPKAAPRPAPRVGTPRPDSYAKPAPKPPARPAADVFERQASRPAAVARGTAGEAAGAEAAVAADAEGVAASTLGRAAAGLRRIMPSAGAVGAIVGAGVTIGQDTDKVASGEMQAGDATADVAVEAAIGAGSAIAGAEAGLAAGAAIGSVVPIVGTAIGAVAGLVVGAAAGYVVNEVAHRTGAADAVKRGLGSVLDATVERPLQTVWQGVGAATEASAELVGPAAHAVADALASIKSAAAGRPNT